MSELPWKLEVLGEYCYRYATKEAAEAGKVDIINNLVMAIGDACPSTDLTGSQMAARFEEYVIVTALW